LQFRRDRGGLEFVGPAQRGSSASTFVTARVLPLCSPAPLSHPSFIFLVLGQKTRYHVLRRNAVTSTNEAHVDDSFQRCPRKPLQDPKMQQPHLSHSEPWAHAFICCDAEHSASTSVPAPNDGMDMYCCADDQCEGGVECCADPKCDGRKEECCEESHAGCSDRGVGELEEWACTKEGCHAIQQYVSSGFHYQVDPGLRFPQLECCTQIDCNVPAVPNVQPNVPICDHQHTAPAHCHYPDVVSQPMSSTWQPAMTASTSGMKPSPNLPTHICHWQNCHRTFNSMPDLLGHVASDHLGAPGFAPPPPAPLPQQIALPPVPSPVPAPDLNSPFLPSQAQAEADHLLSCLWDDCFPLPECTAPVPETCPTHQTHTQTSATGEPFSPQTMLRHVLEEHLGLPGEIIGWGPEFPPLPLPPIMQGAVDRAPSKMYHHHHLHLPTPSPSIPSPPPGTPPICLWPGCTHQTAFSDPSSLMDHLSVHIGKGKDSYICFWDGCGGPGGRLFQSRQKVLRHLQSHTGHRPFVCEVCEKAFSEATPLAAHMRRHAQESEWHISRIGRLLMELQNRSFAIIRDAARLSPSPAHLLYIWYVAIRVLAASCADKGAANA